MQTVRFATVVEGWEHFSMNFLVLYALLISCFTPAMCMVSIWKNFLEAFRTIIEEDDQQVNFSKRQTVLSACDPPTIL